MTTQHYVNSQMMYNNFLQVSWFLAKNLSNFVPLCKAYSKEIIVHHLWRYWPFLTKKIFYVCWFLAKNQSNFVSLLLKLDNPNCHNQRGPPWISSKATSSFMSWSWRCSLTTLSSKAQESWSLHNASTVTKELDRRTYLLSDVPNKYLLT